MPKFSQESFSKLATCHPDLQTLFYTVIKYFDCLILVGYRNQADQDAAYAAGNSELKWPNSQHNSRPSNAVDAAPYEPGVAVDWKDLNRFYYFGGVVMGIAKKLKEEGKIAHNLRWGGDFNMNTETKDDPFKDVSHFELIP